MNELLTALALVMFIEGLMPFISPVRWREAFSRIMALSDGQIRFIGLIAMLLGLSGLFLLR